MRSETLLHTVTIRLSAQTPTDWRLNRRTMAPKDLFLLIDTLHIKAHTAQTSQNQTAALLAGIQAFRLRRRR